MAGMKREWIRLKTKGKKKKSPHSFSIFTSFTLAQSMCILRFSGVFCLNVVTRSLLISYSAPLLLSSSFHVLFFYKYLTCKKTKKCSFIVSLTQRISCQTCLPGHLERDRKGKDGDVLHLSGALDCLWLHWWGTNSCNVFTILCVLTVADESIYYCWQYIWQGGVLTRTLCVKSSKFYFRSYCDCVACTRLR